MSASGFLLIKCHCESWGRGMKELGRSSASAGMAGGDLCRTSLPIGEGLVHAWLVSWWIHSHRGRQIFLGAGDQL